MDELKKCRWQDRDGKWHDCEHDATHDNGSHCIFHAKEKDPQEFRDALAGLIRRWRKEKIDKWDFSGFVFVDVQRVKKQPWKHSEYNLFHRAVFLKAAYFISATFSGAADFRSATFSGAAYFRSATFSGAADFISATFSGAAYFISATFCGAAYFISATFSGSAYFISATFSGSAAFMSATFSGSADFSRATFSGSAAFSDATFSRVADFRSATFSGSADFRSATFSGAADFRSVSFARLGDFYNCVIKKYVRWVWPGEGKKRDDKGNKVERGVLRFTNLQFDEGAVLDLKRNSLQDDCKLEIHECEMQYILLEGTDCTQIGFYNNDWPSTGDEFVVRLWTPLSLLLFVFSFLLPCILYPFRGFKGMIIHRDTVGDECYARTGAKDKSDWRLIRRTYQQLARRFREDLDHPRANEFDRGAFEMRRLEMQEKGGVLGWSTYAGLSVYKYLSHYSGSLGLPVFWLVVTTFLCGLVYMGWYSGPARLWIWEDGFSWQYVCDIYADALRVIAVSKTKYQYLEQSGLFIEFMKLLQKLFAATLVTLFIFAVRRRFKH